jgi:succinyl-CoA synthetase alpha subunit
MSILVDKKTKIVIQGITGREAATTTREMLEYGSKVLAGVTPGKGGQSVHGVPVYDTIKEAVEKHGVNASVISVPPAFARDAAMECADNGIKTAVILTERVPRADVLYTVAYSSEKGMRIIGPNSPGVISPGKCKLGFLGGNNAEKAFKPGTVGIISRSGGMTTEIANLITRFGMGISTAVGMGGDPIVGSTYLDLCPLFDKDRGTTSVVLYCEPGGQKEEALAEWLKGNFKKPVVVFIGGRFVDNMPGMRFGHASVIVRPGSGSTAEKARLFREAGAHVVENYSEIPRMLREADKGVG